MFIESTIINFSSIIFLLTIMFFIILQLNAHGHPAHGGAHGGHGHDEGAIPKWEKLNKSIDNLLARIDIDHMAAYVKAADKHLKVDEGHDYTKLEDKEIAAKFVDTMMEHYEAGAKAVFKVKGDAKLGEAETNMLMQAYLGKTKAVMLHEIYQHGENYTAEYHQNEAKKLKQVHEKNLRPTAAAHIKESHLDEIIKHIGVESKVDKSKMTIDDAKGLLDLYRHYQGSVPEKAYKKSIYYKKADDGHGHADAHAHH